MAPKRIPNTNWVETQDPKSGKTYYANVVTKESSWVYPTAQIKKEQAEKQKKKNDIKKAKSTKEGQWVERQDKEGRVYYANPTTGESQWHRPDNVISTDALKGPSAEQGERKTQQEGKGKWVPRHDPRSGRIYYYNPTLQQTSWTNPDEEAEKAAQAPKTGLQRLSMSIGQAAGGAANTTRRLSQRLSNAVSTAVTGGKELDRHSARYSLNMPSLPTNKTENRMSIRLGGSLNLGDGRRLSMGEDDPFAKLRALKNQGELPTAAKNEVSVEELKKALKIDLKKLEEGISHDILDDTKSFSDYAEKYFNKKKKKGKGELETRKMILWEKGLIPQPLHALSDSNLAYDATRAFKILQQYCGDSKTKKPLWDRAQVFLSYAIAPAPEFHDEILCQLMKQTNANDKVESAQRAWELMALTLGVIKPSQNLSPYLKAHISQKIESPGTSHIKQFAEYSLLRLKQSEELDVRGECPARAEIEASINHEPFVISCFLINNTSLDIEVESWTTMDDIAKALGKRLQIEDVTPFGLFELNESDEERVLDPEDRVMDVMAFWDREKSRNKRRHFRMLFKVRLFFDINEEDTAAVELCYYQAVYDVTDSRYPCSREDAVILAAFEAQEKFGDYDGTDIFKDDLHLYVQSKFLNEETNEALKQEIYAQHAKFEGYDSLAAKVNYLDYIKAWKFYGSSYFYCQTITKKILQKQFPENVIIAINNKAVLVIDPMDADRQILAEFPYAEIVTWGFSTENFVLVVGNLVRSQKLFFESDEGHEMNSLIHAYVNKLLEAEKAVAE